MKLTIAEYTKAEFLKLVVDICNVNVANENEHNHLVMHFCKITEHPDGSDLIYYPENPKDGMPDEIVNKIVKWRQSQGLPCFKEE